MSKRVPPIAVITGASSGIGLSFAKKLAAKGYNLIVIARRKNKLEQLAEDLQKEYKTDVNIITADLSKLEDIQRVSNGILEFENVEVLVNNAGFGLIGSFVEDDPQKQTSMLMVHNLASFLLCRTVIPDMLRRNCGIIVNVASMSGLMVKYGNVIYTSTKSFLITLSQSLQEELKASNIKIQALCPGMTKSEFHDSKELQDFDKKSVPRNFWMTSDKLVEKSLKALNKRKTVYIPGLRNKLVVWTSNNILIGAIIRFFIRKKLKKK